MCRIMRGFDSLVFDITNKCFEKKFAIKLTKWTLILINLLVIAISIYVFKWLWKDLSVERQELLRQKLLRNTELPINELMSSLYTRRAVLITSVVSAITLAIIGLVGAFKLNECLIDIYAIFCIIITIILALGYKNYANHCLYFGIALTVTGFGGFVSFCLLRAIKIQVNWRRPPFQLLTDNRYEI